MIMSNISLIPPRKILVRESSGMGLGCFATEKISEGEVFEECYLISASDSIHQDYYYRWPKNTNTNLVIALGFGSIYNHSDQPNADWRDGSLEDGAYRIFQFYALRDILPGEEIFIYYGGDDYWNARPYKNKI